MWKLFCGNKEVALYGMLLSNLVLATEITFFMALPILPLGIFVFEGLGLSVNLIATLQMFFNLKNSDENDEESSGPLYSNVSAPLQTNIKQYDEL